MEKPSQSKRCGHDTAVLVLHQARILPEDDNPPPSKVRTRQFRSRHSGQQGVRDALLVIVRSAASVAMPHGSPTLGLPTPAKSGVPPEHGAPASASTSPASEQADRRHSDAPPAGSPSAARWTPRRSGITAIILESPARRKQTALSELRDAKLGMAQALEQLSLCADGSDTRLRPNPAQELA